MKKYLKVELNGTDENPYHVLGLTHNPFPQYAEHGKDVLCLRLQKLGGDTIPDVDYIRKTLEGFHPEFIDLCCAKFEKGKYIKFRVWWEEKN